MKKVTTYEKVISDINGPLDEESKKQSIAQALLCSEVTDRSGDGSVIRSL